MTNEMRLAIASALKQWRASKGFTQKSLAAALGSSQASVATWENGKTPIGRIYLPELKKLGFELPETSDEEGDEAINREADKAADEIARLLSLGSPLAEVYSKAMQAQAGFLKGEGLSGGRKRTWDTLLKTIKDAIAERKGHEPIEAHPQWPDVKKRIGEALLKHPDALRDLHEALRLGNG